MRGGIVGEKGRGKREEGRGDRCGCRSVEEGEDEVVYKTVV
jgi:hypothetical protein